MSSDEYAIMDKRDESQIMSEIQGNFMKQFVYKFKIGKREVTGISWSGIKEIAYRVQGIDTVIESTEHTEEAYTFIVKATNKNIDSSRLGVGSCLKKEAFAIQKALSKAQRNAIRGVIPEKTIEMFLTEFEGKPGNVDTVPNADDLRDQVEAEYKVKEPSVWGGQLGIAEIQQYLTDNGLPGEKFKIRHDEPTRMYVVDDHPFFEDADLFNLLKNLVFEMGGEYNREEKKTVFKY